MIPGTKSTIRILASAKESGRQISVFHMDAAACGPIHESIGLMTPGQSVDFFRFVFEQYDDVVTNEFDQRHPEDTLGLKFLEIKERYDVIFQPQHQGCLASEWTENDTKIRKGVEPYYLRANTAPGIYWAVCFHDYSSTM